MRGNDRVINRLEIAGAALSEAIQLSESVAPTMKPLADPLARLNVGLGDARQAARSLDQGDNAEAVITKLRDQLENP